MLGVETKEQLLEDFYAFQEKTVPKEFIQEIKKQINQVEDSIIFPSLWSNGKKVK